MADGATNFSRVPKSTDFVQWYFELGWADGLATLPPSDERVATCIAALGGEPEFLECGVPPRYGELTLIEARRPRLTQWPSVARCRRKILAAPPSPIPRIPNRRSGPIRVQNNRPDGRKVLYSAIVNDTGIDFDIASVRASTITDKKTCISGFRINVQRARIGGDSIMCLISHRGVSCTS
jgi:hypothetical protein